MSKEWPERMYFWAVGKGGVRFSDEPESHDAIEYVRADTAPRWQPISKAPKDGTRFWGKVKDDAIAMLWHDEFQAFVASWRRMIMAPGHLINGKPYEDHSPVIHTPTHWMPLPPPPKDGE